MAASAKLAPRSHARRPTTTSRNTIWLDPTTTPQQNQGVALTTRDQAGECTLGSSTLRVRPNRLVSAAPSDNRVIGAAETDMAARPTQQDAPGLAGVEFDALTLGALGAKTQDEATLAEASSDDADGSRRRRVGAGNLGRSTRPSHRRFHQGPRTRRWGRAQLWHVQLFEVHERNELCRSEVFSGGDGVE